MNKKSALSIFSLRSYSIYKCTLGSETMTSIFIQFYNMIISKYYYSNRWLSILDIIIEKGKGLILGKLCRIQLIEANM